MKKMMKINDLKEIERLLYNFEYLLPKNRPD